MHEDGDPVTFPMTHPVKMHRPEAISGDTSHSVHHGQLSEVRFGERLILLKISRKSTSFLRELKKFISTVSYYLPLSSAVSNSGL